MNLFDAARPRLQNGMPLFLDGRAAVPTLYIRPLESGGIRVMAHIQTRSNSARFYETVVKEDAMNDIMKMMTEDPEGLCRALFNWEGWADGPVEPPRPTAALDDPVTSLDDFM